MIMLINLMRKPSTVSLFIYGTFCVKEKVSLTCRLSSVDVIQLEVEKVCLKQIFRSGP